MQVHSNTENVEYSLDELLVVCRPYIEKLARSFARSSYRCEFEDFVSIGMLEACKAFTHLEQCVTNLPAYLCGAARLAMLKEYERLHHLSTESLDAPLSSDGSNSFSLYDLLPDGSSDAASSSSHEDRVQAMHDALARVPRCFREALFLRAGLPGYGMTDGQEAARVLGITRKSVRTYASRARGLLRSDALLREVVGMESQTGLQSDEKVGVQA
jgi:RNA polymerase sigma factor (sigma-70 family)